MLKITLRFDPSSEIDLAKAKHIVSLMGEVEKASLPPPPTEAQLTDAAKAYNQAAAHSTADAVPSPPAPEGLPATSAPLPSEVDVEGLPWDDRIHSGNKTKTQAGTWTRRRNVPDDYFQRIKADLLVSHQNGAIPQFGARRAGPPIRTSTEELAARASEEPPPPPVVEPPAPPQPDVRAPLPAGYANPFVTLVKRVTEGKTAGKWTLDDITTLIASLNNPHVTQLQHFSAHHDAIPAMNAMLDSLT